MSWLFHLCACLVLLIGAVVAIAHDHYAVAAFLVLGAASVYLHCKAAQSEMIE